MESTHTTSQRKQAPHVSSSDDFLEHESYEEILRRCLCELRAESASLFLEAKSGKTLQLAGAIGTRQNHHRGKIISLGEGVSGEVARSKTPRVVGDVSNEKNLHARKERYPVDTFISCPVFKDSSVRGVINVSGRNSGRSFSKRDLKKLQSIVEGWADLLHQQVAFAHFLQDDEKAGKGDGIHGTILSSHGRINELSAYSAGILRCLSQFVVIFDRQFTITYCSREKDFARLFGAARHEAIAGRSILDLPLQVERNKLKERLRELLLRGTPFSLGDVKVKGCPKLCVINMFFSPFSSDKGEFAGGLLLVDDDTKNYETRQRLAEAEKLSLIGSLTSMITHEVNNPLDGVMRLINLSLAQMEADDPLRGYLTEAQKGLHRIASLVSSLLSFSRKSGSLDAEFTPLDRIIDSAVTVVRNRKESKGVSLHVRLDEKNPHVRTNDFYQLLSNLVSNSFDAIMLEPGTIRIETRVEADTLRVSVSDDGCGIPQAMRSRMFEAFSTTKPHGMGTGLGLAIVKKIVEKHEGTMDVQSEENGGTHVDLTFPLDRLTT